MTVKRKNGALYTTSFHACSQCSVMFLNPEQFNAFGNAAPNVEMPTAISLRHGGKPSREAEFPEGYLMKNSAGVGSPLQVSIDPGKNTRHAL